MHTFFLKFNIDNFLRHARFIIYPRQSSSTPDLQVIMRSPMLRMTIGLAHISALKNGAWRQVKSHEKTKQRKWIQDGAPQL